MKFNKIENFERGWIVGGFSPALFYSDIVDIGILKCDSGHKADGHYHTKHIEYNIIISGEAKVNDRVLVDGDIFIYEPHDKSFVEYTKDTILLVIKNPSVKNDKYII